MIKLVLLICIKLKDKFESLWLKSNRNIIVETSFDLEQKKTVQIDNIEVPSTSKTTENSNLYQRQSCFVKHQETYRTCTYNGVDYKNSKLSSYRRDYNKDRGKSKS